MLSYPDKCTTLSDRKPGGSPRVENTVHRRSQMGDRCDHTSALVRVGPLMGIPAILQELGHDPEPIFASAGFKPAQFADPDTEISYVAASRLLTHCVAVTGSRHFGLQLGTRAGPSSLGVAGFILQSAPDVGTALRGLVQHLDLHDQGGVPTLHISGDTTHLGYDIFLSGIGGGRAGIYDISIAVGCNIMRSLCGKGWNPIEVLLSTPAATEHVALQTLFPGADSLQRRPQRPGFPDPLGWTHQILKRRCPVTSTSGEGSGQTSPASHYRHRYCWLSAQTTAQVIDRQAMHGWRSRQTTPYA